MKLQQLEVKWYSPFTFYGSKEKSVFTCLRSEEPGVYLWTIPWESKYLTYYVGETGRAFADRFREHTRDCLYGLYRIYDPKEFATGKKRLIWGGMWKPDRKSPRLMLEFLNRYPELSSSIYDFLGEFCIFLAPLKIERRIRERIESAIAHRLYKQPGLIGEFQDSDIRYLPRRADENSISVKMLSVEHIIGLCNELTV